MSAKTTNRREVAAAARRYGAIVAANQPMERSMPQSKDDLSRSLVAFDQNSSLCAVIELSLDSWLVGAVVPGIARDPLKKLVPDADALLKLLHRWRDEASKPATKIKHIIVVFEAGRDGFWLARCHRSPSFSQEAGRD
jgi:transposase